MYRINTLLFLLFALFSAFAVEGQSYFTTLEVGVSGGASEYYGDLNQNFGLREINAAGGLYARQRLNSYIAIKGGAYYTKVGYSDSYSSNPYQLLRNLNFQSDIVEVSVQAEFNFWAFVTGDKTRRFTPYLTGGVGAFYYNPYTFYDGVKYYLRPLGTEGQNAGYSGRNYSDYAACFPVGVGVKTWITGGVNLSFEISDRFTTTDYLDDVSSTYVGVGSFPKNSVAALLQDRSVEVSSTPLGQAGKQRGNTATKDQYGMAMISVSFNFTSYKCPSSSIFDDELRVH